MSLQCFTDMSRRIRASLPFKIFLSRFSVDKIDLTIDIPSMLQTSMRNSIRSLQKYFRACCWILSSIIWLLKKLFEETDFNFFSFCTSRSKAKTGPELLNKNMGIFDSFREHDSEIPTTLS